MSKPSKISVLDWIGWSYRSDIPFEPVRKVDIARRLEVRQSAVNNWISRDIGFPPARFKVGDAGTRPTELFDWPEVRGWYVERMLKGTKRMTRALELVKGSEG